MDLDLGSALSQLAAGLADGGGSDDGAPGAQKYADDSAILRDIEQVDKDGAKVRSSEEAEWQEAWNFYLGKHWNAWVNDRLVEVDDESVPHIVVNYILHMVTTRLGHLLKNRPLLQTLPRRPDERARNAARLAFRVLEAYWHKLRIPKKLAKALLWTLICGKAFLKVYWDPTAGRLVTVRTGEEHLKDPNGQPLFDSETGEPVIQPIMKQVREGDLCVEVAFPHELSIEEGAQDLEHTQRVIHTTWVPVAEAQRRWGMTKEEIDALKDSGDDSGARLRLEGLNNVAGIKTSGRVRVREAWFRPTGDDGDYPEGLYAVEVGGKIREQGPTPEGYDPIPFVEIDEIQTNTIWSTSTARQLRDLNRIINLELSQQEHVRQLLRYKTLVPTQANIDKDAMDQRDDEVVEYWHPYVPSHLKPPEVPLSHVELRNSLITMMKELGGNFDVLGGRVQGDVRSGRQTAYLQEYAGTVLGVVANQMGESLQRLGELMLGLLQKNVTEERYESYIGRDRRAQAVAFMGENLGDVSVAIQPGSALPISRAEKWDRVEHWMEMKWLDPKVGIRLLDLGDYDSEIYADEEQDRQNADKIVLRVQAFTSDPQITEKLAMARQQSEADAAGEGNLWSERYLLKALGIEAYPFDNHRIHVEQVDRTFRKTRDYRSSPPQVRAIADALVEWHVLLDDPNRGPLEVPIGGDPMGAAAPPRPPGATGQMGESPPPADPGAMGPRKPGAPPSQGGPQALSGGVPPGGGGIAPAPTSPQQEAGQERAEGLPPVPTPRGPSPV